MTAAGVGRVREGKPRLGVMIGDPGGIGPEVSLRAVSSSGVRDLCTPVLIGARHVLETASKACGIDVQLDTIATVAAADDTRGVAVFEAGRLGPDDYRIGESSLASGEASWTWFHTAAALCGSGDLDGWVMGPINSDSILATGHLDDINHLQPAGTFMLRVAGPLRIVPLSEHILLRDVSDEVTPERLWQVISLLAANLERWKLPRRRIAVAGINPHASFKEDVERISPTVERARAAGIDVVGPVAPDSVFRQAMDGQYDAIVTMYHDQGQIVLKTVAFDAGCTIYMGLPHVMVGVPHGSAYEIAGTGRARFGSMLAAITTAAALACGAGLQRSDLNRTRYEAV